PSRRAAIPAARRKPRPAAEFDGAEASSCTGGPSGQRHEIVLADTLQHEKHGGGVARIDDAGRAPPPNGERLTLGQADLILGLLKKYSDRSLHDIKGVVHVAVIMPGHLLGRADLQLGDAKPRTSGVVGTTLYLVERARVLHSLHGVPRFRLRWLLDRWRRRTRRQVKLARIGLRIPPPRRPPLTAIPARRGRMLLHQLERREFITLIGGAALARPLPARAPTSCSPLPTR